MWYGIYRCLLAHDDKGLVLGIDLGVVRYSPKRWLEYGLAHDGPATMVEIAAGTIIAILTCF